MNAINSGPRSRVVSVKAIVACMLLVAAGACEKAPAPQPAPSTAPVTQSVSPPPVAPNSAAPPAAPQTAPAAAPAPAPAPAPVVKPIVIPAGTHLTVRLERTLGSAMSAVGENFTATLVNGVTIQGAPIIPRHAPVVGKVVGARAAGKFAGDASLGLRLESVAGHAVVTSTYSRRVEGKGNRTAAVIGGTAVAGALLGALAGHGRGAAIGAVAGGGVGTLGAAETGNNRDIVLPEGTVLTFKLRQATSLDPQPEH